MNQPACTSPATLHAPIALSIAAFCLWTFANPHAAGAQSVYRDPNGEFTVQVPEGWGTQPQGDQGISVVNEKYKASVTVGVMRGPDSSTPSSQKELADLEGQLDQSCKINRRGPTTLAGLSGNFLFASCMDNGSEEVMKFAAAGGPGVMVVLNTAVPRSSLSSVQSTINTIEQSIRLVGGGLAGTNNTGRQGSQGSADHDRKLAALKKACDTGALSQEECQQRMASLNAQSSPQSNPQPQAQGQTQAQAAQRGVTSNDPNFNPNAPNSNLNAPTSDPYSYSPEPSRTGVYRDAKGRYSLTVPDGWTATPMNDGSGTLKLTNGQATATVTLMTWAGDNAAEPKDVVMGIANDMAPHYQNVKLAGEGDFSANGHPAHGLNATGTDSSGVEVVVAIISVQMRGPNFLSIVTSTPIEQANPVNEQIMKMVRSIRFGGE